MTISLQCDHRNNYVNYIYNYWTFMYVNIMFVVKSCLSARLQKIGSILIDIRTYKLGTITAFEAVITSTNSNIISTFEIKESAYYGNSCKEGLFSKCMVNRIRRRVRPKIWGHSLTPDFCFSWVDKIHLYLYICIFN